MNEGDAFRLLGVGPGATRAEVRAAFRRKVMASHPDTAPEETSGADVQALVDAYRLLIGCATGSQCHTVSRGGEGSGSGRRIEVDHRSEPDSPRSTGWTPRCAGCGGTGLLTRDWKCPDCLGAGQLTMIDAHRARVSRCRNCRGLGRVRTLEVCGVCRGTAP